MEKTMYHGQKKLLKPQAYLGFKGLIIFITLMSMFIPLSIDLYLPAMPTMMFYFKTNETMVNMTLIGFYVSFSAGIFLFGPLSDKYGRRRILIMGTLLYLAGSIACALSGSIHQLVVFRVLQALGAGAVMTVSTALVKDCFEGSIKMKVLAAVQAMSVLAPMLAPIGGAVILQAAGWRDTFWVLAAIGAITLAAALLFQETLPREKRYKGRVSGALVQLFVIAKNPGFSTFLFVAAALAAPYMAYLTMSPYIYENYFLLNSQTYSYFFAANSAFAVLGPFIYIRGGRYMTARSFCWFCLAAAFASGLAVLLLGDASPWIFLFSYLPFTLINGAIRPFSTNILLEQQEQDAGSASSVINAVQTILGSCGMIFASFQWSHVIKGLGTIMLMFSTLSILVWLFLLHSRLNVKGLISRK